MAPHERRDGWERSEPPSLSCAGLCYPVSAFALSERLDGRSLLPQILGSFRSYGLSGSGLVGCWRSGAFWGVLGRSGV